MGRRSEREGRPAIRQAPDVVRAILPRWLRVLVPGPLKQWANATIRRQSRRIPGRGEFEPAATEQDIRACYRILLGRLPDPDGWRTYQACIRDRQLTVDQLTERFLSSPEFRNRRLFPSTPRSSPDLVDLGSFKIFAPPDDFEVGHAIVSEHVYEPHVTTEIQRSLGPGQVFIDLGAHIGYFSLMAASIVGSAGRVVSFEPNQTSCSLLYLSAAANTFANIDIYPFAVAHERKPLVVTGSHSYGSIGDLERIDQLEGGVLTYSVTLDEVLRDFDRIDVIKMDIEGAEALALQGAGETIRTHRPVIFSEFSPAALQSISKVSGTEFLERIAAAGYEISVIRRTRGLLPCGRDIARVLRALRGAAGTHLDLVAHPGGGG